MESPPTSDDAGVRRFLAWLAGEVFERRRVVDPYCAEVVLTRMVGTLFDVEAYYLDERPADGRRLRRDVARLIAQDDAARGLSSEMRVYLDTILAQLAWRSSAVDRSSWRGELLSARPARVPGMLYPEAMRYYKWLSRTAPPCGEIVELGSWMGLATSCLAEGLSENVHAAGRRIHAIDAFVWRDWMVPFAAEAGDAVRDLRDGRSFLELFLQYVEPYKSLIEPHAATLGGPSPDPWWDAPIAVLVVDHTDRYDELESVWQRFEPWFVGDETIVVFNQYGNARAVEVRAFCHDRADRLVPAHKPRAATKGFRYRA